ncbi:hypothetical protein M4D81_05615 [Paenibacillus sp. p3-SID867]|uniref:hypothetical protein n=1 Tax=Paenibacillus sp. p3-SID867 TaxID=2916363 RepID=UPI0021A8FAD4|nr:hypothetical protein [Paenibacillus sp. p3-SID867]MCT1398481.1 hypothetical protein [Paenibacillus sp. p3-SID867]
MLKKIFQKKDPNYQLVEKINQVTNIIPAADVFSFFNQLTDAYNQSQSTKVELARIEAIKESVLLEIQNKYDLYHKVFDQIFDERRTAINKSFDLIDKGLDSGDKELVSIGMQGLSKIVSSSPFANMEQLSNMLNGNKIIEI